MKDNFQYLYDHKIHQKIYEDYIDILKPYIESDTIVIDCGCGTGKLSSLIEKQTPHVFAFDLDEKMIEIAKQKTTHVSYLKHDMHESWPFFGDVIIMSMDVINFSNDPYRVLMHAIDALNDSGVICLDMYRNGIDLNYRETSLEPFPYTWILSHTKNEINHNIKSKQFDISIKQYVHDIKEMMTFMENQGFRAQVKASIDQRKSILICQR